MLAVARAAAAGGGAPAAAPRPGGSRRSWRPHLEPPGTQENGYVERFNGKFLDECLNAEIF
jgi:hypothetical protein